ncbi:MAG: TIM barrel protein [Micromonosporaceae bacterium]|nr:TIM barrel protein [Micromonosporaceae bacterium]
MKFDVNLSILFTELPLLQRPAAAASVGFEAVEFWWPFADPAPGDAEVDAFLTAIKDAGVRLVGLNFAGGDLPGGERGLLSQPARSPEFRDNIAVAVGIARATGCRALNALYGNRVDGVAAEAQDELAGENLALAAKAAAEINAVVLIEALNALENPRYPLTSAADAILVCDRVRRESGAENLRFLADLYHLGVMGEDLPAVIAEHADRIGHVQIADVPGRHQPGTGELDVNALLTALTNHGYDGWIGCEYKPVGRSADSFDWLKPHLGG